MKIHNIINTNNHIYRNKVYCVPHKEKITKLNVFFTILFLVGLYTGIFFYFTEKIFIPYVFCGIASLYFVLVNKNELNLYRLMPIFYIIVITFLGIIFAEDFKTHFFERIKGLLQLIYSISVSLVFFINLRKWHPQKVCKLFLCFVVIIIAGTFLEIFTGFKEVSDEFRHAVFFENTYEADYRDIFFYGIIRPKLFTAEPSHVAKFFTLSLFVWYTLTKSKYRNLMMIVFTIVGFMLIRSPLIIIILPLYIIVEIFFYKKINFNSIINKKGKIIEAGFAILIVISAIILLFSVNTILEKRISQIISGQDDSFGVRITGPALIAVEVIKKYPLWGSGITGKEAISDIIDNVYYKLDVRYYSIYGFSTNLVMSFIIYYGLFGSTLFGIGIYLLLKRLKLKMKLFLVISFCIFGQTMGAFVGLMAWGYFFVIAVITSFASHYFYEEKEDLYYV